jgi:DNA-binding NarL/FixJ family response regulator
MIYLSSNMIHLAIADDQLLFRKGMIALLREFDGIEVSIEADNGKHLVDQLRRYTGKLDVILLDLSMPEMNGIEAMKILKEEFPEIKVIILTVYNEDKFIITAVELGANGYLIKNADPSEVEKSIRTVVSHDFYFNDQTLDAMKNGLFTGKQKLSLNIISELTQREKQILELICKEYTTPEIATQLFISERTVDGHRNNLLAKTGCRNTAGLVLFAVKHNLVTPL